VTYEAFLEDKAPPKAPWYHKISHDMWLGIVTFIYMLSGILYLVHHNGMYPMTALYALIEIVTTIGYGDLNFVGYYDEGTSTDIATDFGKIFMAFYVMVGLSVIAGVITKVAEKAQDAAEEAFRAKMRNAQMRTSGMSEEQVKHQYGGRNSFYFAAFAFAFMIAFGTIFYGTFESCTCSYGRSAAPGCDENNCVTTGGYTKSYVDAFYMSCITLTTVGFGDFAPKSYVGRAVAVIWMLLGIVVTSNFIGEITSTFIEAKKERKNYERISAETFSEIDKDGNGTLSKYEFVSFVLLQYGLVKKEDLDEIIIMYEKLDTSGDGVVTLEDIEHFQDNM
jgi:hypothetical protein